MAKLGGLSKLSMKLGGEPSHQEKAYNALRRLVGEGGSPPNDPLGETTLDGIWRRAKGMALGTIASVTEAALYQAFPSTATDELATYEEIVNSFLPPGASDEERRQQVLRLWVADSIATFPSFTEALEALDARYSVLTTPHATARVTIPGKLFDVAGNNGFDQYRDHTSFPNFADEHVIAVLLDVGDGVAPTGEVGKIMSDGDQMIGEALPAWNDYVVLLDLGFTLDLSLLDVTGFDS